MASLDELVGGEGEDNSLDALAAKTSPEMGKGPDSNYGEAFVSGAIHGATGGYFGGKYEPKDTGESIAKVAGDVVGFTAPMLALGPAGRVGATALGMAKSLAAKEAIVGGVYGLGRKPEEGETRLGNAVKDALLFGSLGLAGEVVKHGAEKVVNWAGKLTDVGPAEMEHIMRLARQEQMSPEQINKLVEGYSYTPGPGQAAREILGHNRPFVMKEGSPAISEGAAAKAEFLKSKELPEIPNLPTPRSPSYGDAEISLGKELGTAAIRTPSDLIGQGMLRPRINFPEKDIFDAKVPSDVPEFNFPTSKRPEFSDKTPKMYTLYKGGYITPEAELTPEGARNARLFDFLRPRSVEEKVVASMEKIPSTIDKEFRHFTKQVKNFIRNEVHGPVGAVTDSFAHGKSYSEALDHGIQTFARERKLEADPVVLKNIMEELVAKSKLSMSRAKEMLPKLDAEMPASDLAMKAQIPTPEAEAIIDELGANVRGALGETSIRPTAYQSSPVARNVLGDEIISPEVLDRALAAAEITPEQFKNAGFLRPDGTIDERGRNLLNMLNPEWKIPYSEKVINRPPKPARVGSYGRKYEPFDVNSPEGRIGLASVRAGGKSTIPLSRGTIEGFLPMSVEEAIARKNPLVRKVPGGYQFTEKGAALAATRPGGIVKEIDVAANRQFERVVGETGEVSVKGGRGGKSFEGFTDDQIRQANLDYEAAKQIVVEYREAALQWKGCPED